MLRQTQTAEACLLRCWRRTRIFSGTRVTCMVLWPRIWFYSAHVLRMCVRLNLIDSVWWYLKNSIYNSALKLDRKSQDTSEEKPFLLHCDNKKSPEVPSCLYLNSCEGRKPKLKGSLFLKSNCLDDSVLARWALRSWLDCGPRLSSWLQN